MTRFAARTAGVGCFQLFHLLSPNRINAQKSTGPNTPKGKSISSQNAVKTGLDARSEVMRCESRPEYDLLIAEYYARFQPAIPEERCLVDDLIQAEWLGRRYLTSATLVYERHFYDTGTDEIGKAFTEKSEIICRAQRCINQTKRNFALALKQLTARQAERAAHPDEHPYEPPLSPPNQSYTDKLASFLTTAELPLPTAPAAATESRTPPENPKEIPPIAS